MKKWVFRLLTGILIATLLTCGVVLGLYYWDAYTQQSRYDELSQLRPQISHREPDQSDPAGATDPTIDEAGSLLPEFLQLYEMNNDIVGWLTVPGTKIDYPVMQTPEDPEYYLERNFDRKHTQRGCLFAQYNADVFTPSDNVILYGHNMRDGSMFGQLDRYCKKAFRDENPYLYFDTLTQPHTYEVFAVFRTTVSVDEGFPYHEFISAASEEDFQSFVTNCRLLSLYETDVSVEYGDKLLCLSTCEYSQTNGRLVVVAKRIS